MDVEVIIWPQLSEYLGQKNLSRQDQIMFVFCDFTEIHYKTLYHIVTVHHLLGNSLIK